MKVFEWFFSSSSSSQQQLSSGAIDIIAIQRKDGSITCSPFHIKLGKGCKKGEKKLVKIKVNGKELQSVSMRLGSVGEAFFVEKVKTMILNSSSNNLSGLDSSGAKATVPSGLVSLASGVISPSFDEESSKQETAKLSFSPSIIER
jgi:phosphatidate phosphatase LPIN